MKRISILLALTSCLFQAGCVAKKDLEASQAELATCEDEKLKLEATVISWEARFDRESTRWTEMETSISEALPRALTEFHQERERIVEMMPEQVQSEVSGYLDDYFATVMKGFEILSQDNSEIKLQLETTNKVLASVGADTRSINTAIDQALAEERTKRNQLDEQITTQSQHLSDLIDQVVEFDQTMINCKSCPERLRLNRRERETIIAFHQELISDLAALRAPNPDPALR